MFTRRINTASCPSARRTGPCSRSNTQKDANTYDGGGGELSLIRDAVFTFGCPVGDLDVPPGPVLKEMLEIEPFLGWWTGRVCSALTCSIMGSSRAGGKKLSVPVRVSGEMGEFGDSDGGEFNGDDDDDMVPRFRDFRYENTLDFKLLKPWKTSPDSGGRKKIECCWLLSSDSWQEGFGILSNI